ncbi:transient receptor potential cation channel subfamily M member-like 2 [Aplysia californica]|uniref:Transient receptor potential cation channel subfamily M member-like 2 n=1 Tax=Aplysia californica TaxID=6500 RepID=A0ABM1A4K4_APLCA|nr:transient receptor potential cation channel subfamily M member-like 2 [Aplysia californica]
MTTTPSLQKFIEENIKRRQCSTFVRAKTSSSLVTCECQMIWEDHSESAKGRQTEEKVPWKWRTHTDEHPTDAFGYVDFKRFAEEPKPYVRLAVDTPMETVLELLTTQWGLPKPNLLISVTGGAKAFQVSSGLRAKFQKGLINAVSSTGAWVVTGGMNDGVMRYVGEAVRDYGYLASGRVVTIGVAPWGCVHQRDLLKAESPVHYPICPEKTEGANVANLDPGHSHFLLVDDGTQTIWQAEIAFRTQLEKSIKEKFKVPVCLLVFEGGAGTLENWESALKRDIPTVILKGSGRVADVLAFAYQKLKYEEETVYNQKGDKERRRVARLDKVTESQITHMLLNRAELPSENLAKFQRQVRSVCYYYPNISVFEMDDVNSSTDIDLAILNSILQDFNNLEKQLKLAMKWNRPDVAREKILTDEAMRTGSLTSCTLGRLMLDAIASNRVQFVELFLSFRVDLNELLTRDKLTKLYQDKIHNRFFLYRKKYGLPDESTGQPKKFELKCVDDVVSDLMLPTFNWTPLYSDSSDPHIPMESPALALFLWSLLMGYTDMSKVFWKEGMEQMASALFAQAMFNKMQNKTKDNEICRQLKRGAGEYSELAVGIIGACFKKHEGYTHDLLKRVMENWSNYTCTEMALLAGNREFLAHSACQSLAEIAWSKPFEQTLPLWKCILAMLFPPLIWSSLRRAAQGKKTKGVGSRGHTAPCMNNSLEHDNINLTETRTANTDNQDLSPNSPPDGIETQNVPEDYKHDRGVLKTLTLLYSCPKVKLSMDVLFYLVFQGMYSYLLVVRLDEEFHCLEVVPYLWGLCHILGMIREILDNRAFTCKSKLWSYWCTRNFNRYDVILCLTLAAAIVLRVTLTGQNFIWARIMFSVNFILFFFRILKNFAAHQILGPLVTMLYGMTYDLLFFLLFLFMFMVAYVVSSEAILHSNAELSWHGVFLIFRRAYLQIFGEEIEDTDTYSYSWCTRNASLANESMTMCGLDDVGSYVGAVLPGIYFLLTNIMLLNLLIAMFNDTFQRMKDDTDKHWAFLRFGLIKELTTRPPCPPPFMIICHLKWLCSFFCRGKCGQGTTPTNTPFRRVYGSSEPMHTDHRLQRKKRKLIHWESTMADEYMARRIQDLMKDQLVVEKLAKIEKQIERLTEILHSRVEMSEVGKPFTSSDRPTLSLSLPSTSSEDTETEDQCRYIKPNLQSRMSPYFLSEVDRFPVPDNMVAWDISFDDYCPPSFTALEILNNPGEINLEEIREDEREGKIAFNSDARSSLMGTPYVIDAGLPRNPIGRTGLKGRGKLLRWGPNRTWDPVITRWKKYLGTDSRVKGKDGRDVLEFLAVLRNDTKQWSFPGGMRRHSENHLATLKVNFQETGRSQEDSIEKVKQMLEPLKKEVYTGYADVPLNTDNAWVETTVANFHAEDDAIFRNINILAGHDSNYVTWQTVSTDLPLWGSQTYFLKLVAELHNASI